MERYLKQDQVYRHLLAMITQGRYQNGEKLPSGLELSRLFNVSHITVRRCLAKLEEEGLLRQIQGRGIFIQQPRAIQEAAVLLDYSRDPHASWPLPIQRALTETGIIANFFDAASLSRDIERFRAVINGRCGFFIFDVYENFPEEIFDLVPENIQRINVHRPPLVPFSFPHNSVLADPFQDAGLAVETLIERGCRRIAVIGGLDFQLSPVNNLFNEGALAALRKHGLDPVAVFRHDNLEPHEIRLLMEEADGCVSILDSLLLQVDAAAAKAGRVVGGDFFLIGRQNSPWAEKYGWSSVDLNAWASTDILKKMMRSGAVNEKHVLPAYVAFRRSCPKSDESQREVRMTEKAACNRG